MARLIIIRDEITELEDQIMIVLVKSILDERPTAEKMGAMFKEKYGRVTNGTPLFHAKQTKPVVSHEKRVGRNYLCPCRSGKKFKKCCINKE